MNNLIEINNLSKAYKVYKKKIDALKELIDPRGKCYHEKYWALKKVNIQVKKGEVLGILGRNGSGKSTLLKVISGVLQPTEGEVCANGDVGAILELSAGFNPELTGVDNIDFYLSLIEHPVSQRESIKKNIIEFAELGEFIHQPIKNYSSGMRSKFAFAVHTTIEPEILILDEVLSVGDDMFKRKCFVRMESLIKSGRTVLFVTHNLKSLREICTRAVLLDQGEIIFEGDPEKVVTLYQMMTHSADQKRYQIIRTKIFDAFKTNTTETLFNNCDLNVRLLPDLQSKTIQEQKHYDVSISDLKIIGDNDQQVNILRTEHTYKIQYVAHFEEDFENVSFRMNFKTNTSLPISASESDPLHQDTKQVKKGEKLFIEWTFKCSFLQGLYFGNLSVIGHRDEEKKLLVRYIDVLTFKVESNFEFHKDLVYMGQDVLIRKAS